MDLLGQIGIGLLGALVGSILGFLGGAVVAERQASRAEAHALAAYERQRKHREAALWRALSNEMKQNAEILHDAQTGKRFGETFTAAWEACFEVPFSERQFQAFSSAYMRMAQYNFVLRTRHQAGLADRVVEGWAKSAQADLRFAETILNESMQSMLGD